MFKAAPHKQKLLISCLIGWAWFLAAAAPPASAEFQAWVMAKLPDTPEGMAVDSKSNIYTTLFHTGEVIMLKDDGSYEPLRGATCDRANCSRRAERRNRIAAAALGDSQER